MKRHIITIAGDHASGQGTLADFLSKELGYEIYRNGQYVRKLAKEKNMDIAEFQKILNSNEALDRQIEKSASDYAKDHENLVIDAKLGWYAVPYSFKVYLRVDLDVAATRIFNDPKRNDTEKFDTIEEVREKIVYRYTEENNRWFKTYGVNRDDMSNYDLVIDTTFLSPDEVCKQVIEKYLQWLDN